MNAGQSNTAAVLLIGNEILSGRTQDANLAHFGKELAALGIALREARVVADIEEEIVAAVRALSHRYTYVFTTGGIGPTHDDITTAAVARAFERELHVHVDAEAKLRKYYGTEALSAPRLKMATVPVACELIDNPISSAPGFRIENVFVLAGVPPIMQAMFEVLRHQLSAGAPILARTVTATIGESRLAEGLGRIQISHPGLSIGSYPFMREGRATVSIVVRGTNKEELESVVAEVDALMRSLGVADVTIG